MNNRIVSYLIELVQEYVAMGYMKLQSEQGLSVIERIRVIGETADYFGGEKAMCSLAEEAQSQAVDGSIIVVGLDEAWDGIGSWGG